MARLQKALEADARRRGAWDDSRPVALTAVSPGRRLELLPKENRVAEALAAKVGARITWFRDEHASGEIGGARLGGRVFLNVASEHPVAAHEIRPELVADFVGETLREPARLARAFTFIEDRGGRVVAVVSLASGHSRRNGSSSQFAITRAIRLALERKSGKAALREFLKSQGLATGNVSTLTDLEGSGLLSFGSLDAAGNRIAAAGGPRRGPDRGRGIREAGEAGPGSRARAAGGELNRLQFKRRPDPAEELEPDEAFLNGPVVRAGLHRRYEGAADVFEQTPGLVFLGKAIRRQVDLAREYHGELTFPFRQWAKRHLSAMGVLHIRETKQTRRHLDAHLQEMRAMQGRRASRARAIALTKLQEAIPWLGMDLNELASEHNPYPQSLNPESSEIAPPADGLRL